MSTPGEIMNRAAIILKASSDARVRRNANSAYQHARKALLGGNSVGGASEALKLATHDLHSASVEHDAKLKGTGEVSPGTVLNTIVEPTAPHDEWVAETNEGLKNGR
jgi:hypothetical protein